MKVKVLAEFYDKFNISVLYGVGEIHEFEDGRASEMIARGLAEEVIAEVKPKRSKKVENDD